MSRFNRLSLVVVAAAGMSAACSSGPLESAGGPRALEGTVEQAVTSVVAIDSDGNTFLIAPDVERRFRLEIPTGNPVRVYLGREGGDFQAVRFAAGRGLAARETNIPPHEGTVTFGALSSCDCNEDGEDDDATPEENPLDQVDQDGDGESNLDDGDDDGDGANDVEDGDDDGAEGSDDEADQDMDNDGDPDLCDNDDGEGDDDDDSDTDGEDEGDDNAEGEGDDDAEEEGDDDAEEEDCNCDDGEANDDAEDNEEGEEQDDGEDNVEDGEDNVEDDGEAEEDCPEEEGGENTEEGDENTEEGGENTEEEQPVECENTEAGCP